MRRVARVVVGLGAVSVLAGCGFLEELAHPPVAPLTPVSTAPPPTPSPTPPPATPVLTVQLVGDQDLAIGPLRGALLVDAHPVAAGLPPLANGFRTTCGLDEATTRYQAVDLTFATGSTSTVVSTGLSVSGPAVDAGVVGLFTDSTSSDVRYCEDGDRTPSTDHLVLGSSGRPTVTTYLVVGPDAPDDALTGLTVALTDLHDPVAGGTGRDGPWTVVGGPASSCLDAPGGLCVSVG